MSTEASKPRAALAGVLSASAGLAAAELAGAFLGVRQTPVVAVGSAFIDIVPSWLKDLAIRLFGTADKVALVIGILIMLTAVASGIGILTAKYRRVGQLAIGMIGFIAAIFATTRPGAGTTAMVPSVLAGLVALLALPILIDSFSVEREEPSTEEKDQAPAGQSASGDGSSGTDASKEGRRKVLVTGGLVLAGSAVVAGLGRLWGGRRSGVETARTTMRVPRGADAPVPPGADFRRSQLTSWRTENPDFYRIDTALAEPLLDLEDWRLRIHGMVDRELTLSFADLQKRRIVHRWVTLACVSNEVGGDLIGNALWSGVPIADVLKEVGVHADADAVRSTSQDGWTCGTPLSALTDGRDSLLAFAMNGESLPVEHGFPVRMVVPGLYGFVSATKWVVDIEVTRFDRFKAYWSTRGWSEQAPIKTASRIDAPRSGAKVDAGTVIVGGVAWAQHRGISRVEVRVGDGPWREARLAGQPTKDSWRQWTYNWDAGKGDHLLQVRAFDGNGEPQTNSIAPPAPDGAAGYHAIDVSVV